MDFIDVETRKMMDRIVNAPEGAEISTEDARDHNEIYRLKNRALDMFEEAQQLAVKALSTGL